MASGLLAISTSVRLAPQLLDEQTLAPVGDVAEYASRIIRIANNPNRLTQLSIQNRQSVEAFRLSVINTNGKAFTKKYILKKALEGLVPHEVICRKKHGFGVPVGRWFRNELKDYVRDILLSPQAIRRRYFKEETLRRLIDEHQSGKRDHGHRLWALLTFEIWHRVFIDRDINP